MFGFNVGKVGRVGILGSGPSFNMSFITSGTLDSRITFSRASSATYFNSSGVLVSASNDVARLEYSPVTLQLMGLLIEEARTNLVFPSGNLATMLTASSVTLTANSAVAPDGTTTMTRIAEQAVTAAHYAVVTGVTITANSTCTFSAFVRAQQNTFVQLFLDDNTNGSFVTFDLTGGVISQAIAARGTGTATLATITYVGSSTYKVSITGKADPAATGVRAGFVMCTTGTPGFAPSYAGNASNGLLAWGGQFEVGAFPTSYIVTVGSSASRSAEQARVTPLGPWFNPSAGSMGVDYYAPFSTLGTLGGISDGVFANSVYLSSGNQISTGAGQNTSSGSAVAATYESLVGVYTISAPLRVSLNGASIGSSASIGATPFSSTRLSIGCTPWALDGQINGYIRGMKYWPRALSNAELLNLSVPTLNTALIYDYNFTNGLPGAFTFTRASSATYYDPSGTIQTVSNNVPRIDCSPAGGAALGLLMEETRTNLFLFSADLSQMSTNTSPNDSLRVANQAIAPDGTLAATNIIPTATSGSHIAFRTFTGATSTQYIYSVFLKAAGYNVAIINLSNTGFPANGNATFDLSLGTVTNTGAGATASGIQACANGWYRCWISVLSLGSAGTYVASINPVSTGVFIGDGVSGIYAWGGQVEASTFISSYVPTTGSTATRSGDACTLATPGTWYNPPVGTFATEFRTEHVANTGTQNGIFRIDDGVGTNNLLDQFISATGQQVSFAAANTVTYMNNFPGGPTLPNVGVNKYAMGYGATYRAYTNTLSISDQAGVAPYSISRLIIGTSSGSNAWQVGGHIRRFRYWSRLLTTTEFTAITT